MSYYFAVVPHCRQKELYHFGIKGMKWGVRRYRNKDGSYTKAGLLRYKKKKDRVPSHEHLLSSRDPDEIYKYRKYYTDQELQGRLNRLNTEENVYRKTKSARRKEFAKKAGAWALKTAVVAGPAVYGAYNIWRDVKHPDWKKPNSDAWYRKKHIGADGKEHSFVDYLYSVTNTAVPKGKRK